MSYDLNGWKYISIYGSPEKRGYAYGYLCGELFTQVKKMLNFFIYDTTGETWEYMIEEINKSIKLKTQLEFPEFYEEMEGIADGYNSAMQHSVGNESRTTLDEIIAWNFYLSMSYWMSSVNQTAQHRGSPKEGGNASRGASDKCSVFIAVGKDFTESGKIVVAHNSFTDFIDGQYSNVILDLHPEKGNRFIMQTSPCWIWSGTDFFVNSKGIIGTETTIGGFIAYENNIPVGYRIRQAMQYGNTMDECVEFLLQGNSGDYANTWYFGDTKTNEIMRFELGLKYHNIERTKNGYYIGFNAAYDPRIRNIECVNSGFDDIRRHQGARRVRLDDLIQEYKGKINIDVAKIIISDHYDVYLKKENPSSRTVCSHYELDAREYMSDPSRPKPYAPRGAVDGIVCDSDTANKMGFVGRFGSSCGMPFDASEFCNKNRQWKYLEPYLKDRPTQPWTEFLANTNTNTNTNTNKMVAGDKNGTRTRTRTIRRRKKNKTRSTKRGKKRPRL